MSGISINVERKDKWTSRLKKLLVILFVVNSLRSMMTKGRFFSCLLRHITNFWKAKVNHFITKEISGTSGYRSYFRFFLRILSRKISLWNSN